MFINEILKESTEEVINSINQVIIGLSDDKNVSGKMSVDSFISLVGNMGISINDDMLMSMVEQGQFPGIADMDASEIRFSTEIEASGPESMGIPSDAEQSEQQVDQMAHRAMDRRQ